MADDSSRCPQCGQILSQGLVGRKAITRYLIIGKNTFYKWVRSGLPVRRAAGIWVSNRHQLDDWTRCEDDLE